MSPSDPAPVADDRPPFARSFPRDPSLDPLVAAFAAGDYARVREAGAALAANASDDAIRRAARELIARTEPDPLAKLLLAITAALLIALTGFWLAHAHPDGPAPAPPPPPAVERVD